MKRDMNGLKLAMRHSRAQRMLVDTVSGTILGYADIYGKTRDVRPQVYQAIAGSRVAVLTIWEYLRMTRDDDNRREEQQRHITAGEWYRSLDGQFDTILALVSESRRDKSFKLHQSIQ